MSEQPTILCVLSEEQRSEYHGDLGELEQRGHRLVHMEDPNQALDRAGALDPQLVIAGMELGRMEGLEFLAFFMKRYPAFERTVVVLPRKDDPFPPMAHSRDPATGRSLTDEVTFEELVQRLPEVDAAPGQGEPPTPRVAAAPSAASVMGVATGAAQPRPRWLVPAIIAGVVALAGVGAVVAFYGSEEPAAPGPNARERSGQTAAHKPKDPEPAPTGKDDPSTDRPSGSAESSTGAAEGEASGSVEEETPGAAGDIAQGAKGPSDTPSTISLEKPLALPLTFKKSGARPLLTSREEFDRIVRALVASPGTIELAGHTSNEGDPAYNDKLGSSRAAAVKELLVRRGIPRARVVVTSHGGEAPSVSNATEAGRTRNRRVTVHIRR